MLADSSSGTGSNGGGNNANGNGKDTGSSGNNNIAIIVPVVVGGVLLVAVGAVVAVIVHRKTKGVKKTPLPRTQANFEHVSHNASVWDTNVQVRGMCHALQRVSLPAHRHSECAVTLAIRTLLVATVQYHHDVHCCWSAG